MDKLSRAVLDDVSRRPDEYALLYARDMLNSSADSFDAKPAVLQSCIENLETGGYLKFNLAPDGAIVGFSRTYSGMRWRQLAILRVLRFVCFNILVPIIVAFFTALITSLVLW